MQHQEGSSLTPNQIDGLLQTSIRAIESGNIAGARALLRLLTNQQPDDARLWRWLADIAETDEERQHALEHVDALDTNDVLDRQWVEDHQLPPHEQPAHVATAPHMSTGRGISRLLSMPLLRWGVVVGTGLGLLLTLWFLGSGTARAPVEPHDVLLPTIDDTANVIPTLAGLSARQVGASTSTPVNVATPFPLPLHIASGNVLEQDNWHTTLIRPEYIQMIEESLGGMQPRGRFVLAVVAIGNTSEAARRTPPDFFVLIDDQGRSYRAASGASTAYLATYGRGRRGDLALEDKVPPGGGMFSMPLIFDVPMDATGLVLTITRNPDGGWPVLDTLPSTSQGDVLSPTLQMTP